FLISLPPFTSLLLFLFIPLTHICFELYFLSISLILSLSLALSLYFSVSVPLCQSSYCSFSLSLSLSFFPSLSLPPSIPLSPSLSLEVPNALVCDPAEVVHATQVINHAAPSGLIPPPHVPSLLII